MLIRMVRMVFQPEKVHDFLKIFIDSKEKIQAFEGCQHLELLRDLHDSTVFTTYSFWESEEDLNNYRKSALFGSVWIETKKLFASPPQAFSMNKIDEFQIQNLLDNR